MINLVFVIHLAHVAQHFYPIIKGVLSVIGHAAHDIFPVRHDEGRSHGFVDGFHQDLRRFIVIRDGFGNIDDFHPALPQTFLSHDGVNPISGKPVCLPEDQIGRTQLLDLIEHQLKCRPVIPGAAVCGVIIFFDDVVAVMLGILVCCVFLLDDAHISLRVGAVAVVAYRVTAGVLDKSCDGSHGVTSFLRNTSFTVCVRSFDRALLFLW